MNNKRLLEAEEIILELSNRINKLQQTKKLITELLQTACPHKKVVESFLEEKSSTKTKSPYHPSRMCICCKLFENSFFSEFKELKSSEVIKKITNSELAVAMKP